MLEILALFVIMILFAAAIDYQQMTVRTKHINEYMRRRGATDIVVSWNRRGGDQYNAVYDVEYTDRQGRHRVARCKVSGGLFGVSELYWRDPPNI